ncbi:hypothetical protein NP493_1037g00031 [Ridgeia piscesae]|uniref:EGF-like domain-containing protein n=1 Tax=Ridgeia piscesae TaxID=27915 RepID=A0AAD9KHW0_RIDPI|nr:hypothetical protein NP493_1037g00031 [Ridgeia piscesae]
MDAINISFSAVDSKGGVAPTAVVTVNLCNCSGHGKCLFGEHSEGQVLASTFRIVACKCNVGYTGSRCADDIDGCDDNPCTVGTNCTDLTPAEHVTQGRAYVCTDCPIGYVDDDGTCVDFDECSNQTHSCTDTQLCINMPGTFTCVCVTGYRMTDGTCHDIDECADKSSGCEQNCANNDGSFACSCSGGYTLTNDSRTCKKEATLETRCRDAKLNCEHGCRWKQGETDIVECFCNEGFTLDQDGRACNDVNECTDDTDTCDTNCVNINGGYECTCNDGYLLNDDKRTCRRCPVGQWGPQCTKLCNCETPDTTCNPTTGCVTCPRGFEGGDCSIDTDECLTHPCDAHSTCVNTPGTFRCDCDEGYTQSNATTCKEFDECESDPCQNGGTCSDRSFNYTCTCVAGYVGMNCETDVNECESSPCLNGATCFDLENRYRCKCMRGFTGVNCETDYDDCSSNSCVNGATCQDGSDSYTCQCLPGYSGTYCETDVDECSSAPCQNGATCSDRVNGYHCNCTPGFVGNNCGTGQHVYVFL